MSKLFVKTALTSAVAVVFGMGVGMGSAQAGTSSWAALSNALAAGLPLLAAGYSVRMDDMEGTKELFLTMGGTVLANAVVNEKIHATSPDGSTNKSFSSDHTAVAFAAARFIQKRYGEDIDPALLYGAATLTAIARVKADKHHARDTLVGGAIGFGVAQYLTQEYMGGQVSVAPLHNGLAVAWQRQW
jgi:membrane-associated phospholipid phosphatase